MRLVGVALALAVACGCTYLLPGERFRDEEISLVCARPTDGELDVTFTTVLRGGCTDVLQRRCEATLEGSVMVVTGVAVWRENQDFCSNTHAGPVQATCELPAGWEDAVVEVDGVVMEVNVCGYS